MIYIVTPLTVAFVAAGSAWRTKGTHEAMIDAAFDAFLYAGAASFCLWVTGH
jgi:hypothetical protein